MRYFGRRHACQRSRPICQIHNRPYAPAAGNRARCTHSRDHRHLCNAWGSYAQSVDGRVRKLQLCNSPGHGRPDVSCPNGPGSIRASHPQRPSRQGGPELADLLYGTGGPPRGRDTRAAHDRRQARRDVDARRPSCGCPDHRSAGKPGTRPRDLNSPSRPPEATHA